jgi:hypothetical protein
VLVVSSPLILYFVGEQVVVDFPLKEKVFPRLSYHVPAKQFAFVDGCVFIVEYADTTETELIAKRNRMPDTIRKVVLGAIAFSFGWIETIKGCSNPGCKNFA